MMVPDSCTVAAATSSSLVLELMCLELMLERA